MYKKRICMIGISILLMITCVGIGTVSATEAVPEVVSSEDTLQERETEKKSEEVQEDEEKHSEEEQEDKKLCADLWEKEDYWALKLGNCYPGSRVEYDIKNKQTILYPGGWQKQLVLREDEKAELYYGKYKGKVAYEEFERVTPVLNIDFFLKPIRALELTTTDIDSQEDRCVIIENEEQLEVFYAPLFYEGFIKEDEVRVTSVEVRFNEEYLPEEVRFTLASNEIGLKRLGLLEEELVQTFSYLSSEDFEGHLEIVKNTMNEIVPEKEVTIRDYVNDLNNILQVEDEYFIQRLTHQGEELAYYSGWDKRAVLAYLEAVNTKFNMFANNNYEAKNVTRREYIAALESIYQSARTIGSDVYTFMFESSKLKPKKKALLVLRQMGAYLDKNGMLQMGEGDRFASDMPPHASFLEDYAACVRKAYRKDKQKYKTLDDQMIHQFRMYIDKHNIEYIRNYYKGPTDYAKLQAYAKNFEMKLFYGEPSRHHNKIQRGGRFQQQKYDKILIPNRLSEFIVDVETGKFITQWDILQKNKDGTIVSDANAYLQKENIEQGIVVDTESFNYAPADYVNAHTSLDVLPATPKSESKKSPYLENYMKIALKELWESPRKGIYREKYKSPKDYVK